MDTKVSKYTKVSKDIKSPKSPRTLADGLIIRTSSMLDDIE